ncbi:MAG: peptide chain release factor 1 [Pseudomonadota bacterium]|nr:peptide chain release factor 1 [Pseudomonadota bacterium]
MSFEENLNRVVARYQELEALMSSSSGSLSDEFVNMSKEYSELGPVVQAVSSLRKAVEEASDLAILIDDSETDSEMKALAEEEFSKLKFKIPHLEKSLQLMLLPKDAADSKNAILEVRAGTGGEEAGLFAADLFRMYQRFSESCKWKFEILSINETGVGGYKEAFASVSGSGVFAKLKFESGVHRVQRVPSTESSGRIHTSAATVAVMPEAEDVDINIEEKDLRIDVFRASGPGGQSVNTTDSAVRITHLPTGVVVSQQDEKSQHKNKAKALRVLRSRIYEAERQKSNDERAQNRKAQVGSGDRSERIRTYNYPERRVTDHRVSLTVHKLDSVMNGDLEEIINALISDYEAQRLAEIE